MVSIVYWPRTVRIAPESPAPPLPPVPAEAAPCPPLPPRECSKTPGLRSPCVLSCAAKFAAPRVMPLPPPPKPPPPPAPPPTPPFPPLPPVVSRRTPAELFPRVVAVSVPPLSHARMSPLLPPLLPTGPVPRFWSEELPALPPRADTEIASELPPCVEIVQAPLPRVPITMPFVTPLPPLPPPPPLPPEASPPFPPLPPATWMRMPGAFASGPAAVVSIVQSPSRGESTTPPLPTPPAPPFPAALPKNARPRPLAPLPPVAESRMPGPPIPEVVIRPLPCTSSVAPAPPGCPECPASCPPPPAPPLTVRLIPASRDWIVPNERIVAEVQVSPGWPVAPGRPTLPIAMPMLPALRVVLPPVYSRKPVGVAVLVKLNLMPMTSVTISLVRSRTVRCAVPVGKSDANPGGFSRTPVD